MRTLRLVRLDYDGFFGTAIGSGDSTVDLYANLANWYALRFRAKSGIYRVVDTLLGMIDFTGDGGALLFDCWTQQQGTSVNRQWRSRIRSHYMTRYPVVGGVVRDAKSDGTNYEPTVNGDAKRFFIDSGEELVISFFVDNGGSLSAGFPFYVRGTVFESDKIEEVLEYL